MRIAVLYAGLSGYIASCFREYKNKYNADFLIVHWPISPEAPFNQSDFQDVGTLIEKNNLSIPNLKETILDFKPDAVITSGWMDKDYLKWCKTLKQKGIPVIAGCDTQANGSVRQFLAGVVAPWYLHKSIDVLWVTGERQRQLAYKLGYQNNNSWEGFYSCDWNKFSQVKTVEENNSFLYIGRLIERKGIRTLLAAYQNYRKLTKKPWNLIIAGTGPLSDLLFKVEGVSDLGFIQPNQLPNLFSNSKVFILPSKVEPWGVVLHEAVSAGLPVLATNESGAGVHLVRDGFNGFKFDAGDINALSAYLLFFSNQEEKEWQTMSSNSRQLSRLYTPNLWAKTLHFGLKEIKSRD